MLHQTYTTPFLPRSADLKPRWWPRPRAHRYRIDPLAFVVALIGAPLLIAVLTFWVYLIPVAAVVFGGPIYLLIGTPLLLWFMPRYGVGVGRIALLAIASVALILAYAGVGYMVNAPQDQIDMALFYGLFGAVFAPLWGAAFGFLYPRLERSEYRARNGR